MRALTSAVFIGAVVACSSAGPGTVRSASSQDLQAGITAYRQGQYAQAEAALRSVEGAEAQAYLAASLAKQKKYAEAEPPARAALAANPTHDVAVAALGESLVGQKKYDEAVAALSAAIAKKGDLAYAYYWRGHAHYNKKQPDRMVSDFEMFLRLAPNAPEAPTVKQLLASFR